MKPKLVARSPNGPNSPWKKSLPTISAEGLPPILRPILGYTLWRLYERETYSFHKDASILLTDDKAVSAAAQKIGINVQSYDAFVKTVKVAEVDLAFWGDVEREFGVRPPSKTSSSKGHADSTEKLNDGMENENTLKENLLASRVSEEMVALSTEKHKAKQPETSVSQDNQEEANEAQKTLLENISPSKEQAVDGTSEAAKSMREAEAGNGEETPVQQPQQVQIEAPPSKPRAWADVVSNRIRPIEERYPSPAPNISELSDPIRLDPETFRDPLLEQVSQEKASTIADWVRTVTQASMDGEPKPLTKSSHRKRSPRNKKVEKPSPPQEAPVKPFRPILMQRTPKSSQAASDHAHTVSDKARTPSPPPPKQPVEPVEPVEPVQHVKQEQPTAEAVPSAEQASKTEPASQHHSTNSSASSAQTVASKDTSVAKSAPIEEPEDSEEEVVVFNPRAKRMSAQQQTPKLPTDELPSHARHPSQGKSVHSRNVSVDEPSKLQQPSPEKAVPVKQHRPPKPRVAPVVIDPDAFGRDFASNPRIHIQNGYNRSHPRPNPPNAPSRPASQHSAPRGGARGGRPFIHPQAITALQNGQHSQANPTARGGRQNRMPPAIVNGQNGYIATNQNSVAVNGQVAPRASPRVSPSISPQRLPQTNAPEPDVDFVLQSGPPRGSTRGRGKLWIP